MIKIALGTSNPHKLEEINEMLNSFREEFSDKIQFVLVEGEFNPVENGTTFAENAFI